MIVYSVKYRGGRKGLTLRHDRREGRESSCNFSSPIQTFFFFFFFFITQILPPLPRNTIRVAPHHARSLGNASFFLRFGISRQNQHQNCHGQSNKILFKPGASFLPSFPRISPPIPSFPALSFCHPTPPSSLTDALHTGNSAFCVFRVKWIIFPAWRSRKAWVTKLLRGVALMGKRVRTLPLFCYGPLSYRNEAESGEIFFRWISDTPWGL